MVFSVRHNLAAVQIEASLFQDAILTLEEDLEIYPKNGWALHGLQLSYSELNDQVGYEKVSKMLSDVWASADVKLESSRIK